MKNDLKKLKKDELIELLHKLKNERNTEDEEVQKLKNEIQELKNEHKNVLKTFGAEDESEYLIMLVELAGKTVKSILEEDSRLKEELKEKEILNRKLQKLNNEHKKTIEEIKENGGVHKIKNERGAGRKFKLSDKEIELILKDREFGTSIRNIAKLRGCSVGLVHKIISEHTKKED